MEENKSYNYILPDEKNLKMSYKTEKHSMIIIGANGSGKSRLGAWIEKNDPNTTHRISAQRVLSFGTYITQRSYEQAKNLLLYGKYNPDYAHDARWKWDGEKYDYVSSILDDYENVLSLLVAMQNTELEKYVIDCKEKEKQGKNHKKVPEMILDKLRRIWNTVFPHREINIIDAQVITNIKKNDEYIKYNGKEMSDGERVALYLIGQCLCIPQNKTIIIDEPELHLHHSIMNNLWAAIEAEREDCFFIYITHDTQFAANHKNSKKIWVKEYDGENWVFEDIQETSLPEQLLLDILGNRKPVLFVEGTSDSYDIKIYSEVYKDYYVVPCGSCSSVLVQTKAMNSANQLHHLKCYGIIDRDYRSEYEIKNYEEDKVFTLEVAEVENLFLVEELLQVVTNILGFSGKTEIEKIKDSIKQRFKNEINKQINEAIVSELKYELATLSIPTDNEDKIKKILDNFCINSVYNEIKSKQEKKFKEAETYSDILKVFNCKSLSTSIGNLIGINNKQYRDFIIRHIKGEKSEEIIKAIEPYLPKSIPITINKKIN